MIDLSAFNSRSLVVPSGDVTDRSLSQSQTAEYSAQPVLDVYVTIRKSADDKQPTVTRQNTTSIHDHGQTHDLDTTEYPLRLQTPETESIQSDLVNKNGTQTSNQPTPSEERCSQRYDHRYSGNCNPSLLHPESMFDRTEESYQKQPARRPMSASTSLSTLSRCPSQLSTVPSLCESFFINNGKK